MRVALCFSGAIRSFKSCYPSIYKSFIQPLNPDIFVHMWSFGSDIKSHTTNEQYLSHMKMQNDECDQNYVLNKLKPKKWFIGEYTPEIQQQVCDNAGGKEILEGLNEHDRNYAVSAMGMYFMIHECNKLKREYEEEHGFKYDVVIRLRPDFFYNDNFCLDNFSGLTDQDILLIKDSYCVKARWQGNDKFFAGTSDTMDRFCDLYHDIKDLKHILYKEKKIVEGQNLNRQQIISLGLNIKWIGSPDTYVKFVGRHRVKTRDTHYLVYGCDTLVGFHMCENLLNRGFKVTGVPSADSNVAVLNIIVLSNYERYSTKLYLHDLEEFDRAIIVGEYGALKNPIPEKLVLINSSGIQQCKNRFTIKQAFGPRSIDQVELPDNLEGWVYGPDVAETIFHKIYDKNDNQEYTYGGDGEVIEIKNVEQALDNTKNWYNR